MPSFPGRFGQFELLRLFLSFALNFFMGFYFCSRYIYIDGDPKEVERDMYVAISYFRVLMIVTNMRSEKNLEESFSYFSLTSEHKCRYTQMKLVGETYWWWKDNNRFCRYWFVLQDLLHTRYTPHFLYASEADCKRPNVEHEPEPLLRNQSQKLLKIQN